MGGFFSRRSAAAPAKQVDHGGGESTVVVVHSDSEWSQHWQSHSQSNKLMVIDFSASWCGPCRFIEPAFKELSSRFADAVFFKIDVDELQEVAKQWNVEGMPTFVLVKRGKEVDRVVGASEKELRTAIQTHLKD